MENELSKKKYVEYYNLSNKDKNYEIECNFLARIFKKYQKFNTKEILDLGCGTGIHDKNLAKRGYNILGIDLLKEMIDAATLDKVPNTGFKVGNMINFNLDRKFDACISMFSSMGYITKNEELKSFLKSITRHLRSGGLLILECWNGLGVINELPSNKTKIVEYENFKIIRKSFPKLDAQNHLCDVKFDIEVYKDNSLIDRYKEYHKIRFFFPQELKKYIEDEGFEVLKICKSFEEESPADENTWNMVLISRLKG